VLLYFIICCCCIFFFSNDHHHEWGGALLCDHKNNDWSSKSIWSWELDHYNIICEGAMYKIYVKRNIDDRISEQYCLADGNIWTLDLIEDYYLFRWWWQVVKLAVVNPAVDKNQPCHNCDYLGNLLWKMIENNVDFVFKVKLIISEVSMYLCLKSGLDFLNTSFFSINSLI
jgi:hypothetical protein